MNLRTYGIVAGVIGSALSAWWWRRRAHAGAASPDPGRVIYDNTPTATSLAGDV